MNHNQRNRRQFQRPFRDFSGIHHRLIDRPLLQDFVFDQAIARIQKQNTKDFYFLHSLRGAAIGDHPPPIRQDGSFRNLIFQHSDARFADNGEQCRRRFLDSVDFHQLVSRCGYGFGKRAEDF